MKTIYQTSMKNYRLWLLTIVSIGITSCGSFKNSSYTDNDGIYSSTSNRETTLDKNQTYTQVKPTNAYAEKFKQMQSDLEETEYFTDVDSYASNQQVDTVYVVENSYAGWGNNSTNANVTYYNNGWNNGYYGNGWNNWGYGYNSWYGPGWNNGFYYGNTWGLGFNYGWNNWYSPYYGYGWNNWYSPYYGYNNYGGYNNNHVSYSNGRRGMTGYYPTNSGRSSGGRTATITGRNVQIGNSTVSSPRTRTIVRDNNSFNSPRTVTSPRTTTTSPRTVTSPRTNNTPRTTTTMPSSSSTPRSSGSSGSFGGGRSFGGSTGGSSGGGRSSGGGGRGGR